MFITLLEIFDILLMSLFLGFLFSDFFRQWIKVDYTKSPKNQYWRNIWISTLIAAPGIVFHELGHKFVAMGFGLEATFYAFYHNSLTFILGMGALVMKLFGMGIFFVIPGYVSHTAAATPLQNSIIAFAGPFVNLMFWIVPAIILKRNMLNKRQMRKYGMYLVLTKQINLFLFVFNMLPIPPFDGFQVFSGLFKAF